MKKFEMTIGVKHIFISLSLQKKCNKENVKVQIDYG